MHGIWSLNRTQQLRVSHSLHTGKQQDDFAPTTIHQPTLTTEKSPHTPHRGAVCEAKCNAWHTKGGLTLVENVKGFRSSYRSKPSSLSVASQRATIWGPRVGQRNNHIRNPRTQYSAEPLSLIFPRFLSVLDRSPSHLTARAHHTQQSKEERYSLSS